MKIEAINRASFIKGQKESIKKALTKKECPLKPKHARIIILGTHQEKSCVLFWSNATSIHLESHPLITWKFCHLLHTLIRDGHTSVVDESIRHISRISALGEYWKGKQAQGSSPYCLTNWRYCNAISERLRFHSMYHQIPGTLAVEWKVLRSIHRKPDESLAACSVVLDQMDSLLWLQREVFDTLAKLECCAPDALRQALLAPLTLVVKDVSALYEIAQQYMFHLHTLYPAIILEGHRERFQETFRQTRNFYLEVKKCAYLRYLVSTPDLPEFPPSFINSGDDFNKCARGSNKGGRSIGSELLATLQLHERSYSSNKNGDEDALSSTPPSAPFLDEMFGNPQGRNLLATLQQHEHRCCSEYGEERHYDVPPSLYDVPPSTDPSERIYENVVGK